MRKMFTLSLLCLLSIGLFAQTDNQVEVTYDRRDGTALTLTILKPKTANGKGIISLLSGNFVSNYNLFDVYKTRALTLVNHGYTVFLVMHRSAPRFALPDMLEDIQRSVQFVRYHAAEYKIDPNKLGITGTSSGGHLALLTGFTADIANPSSKDPIARISSSVQAIAVFCPPTDFLNFGKAGYNLAADYQTLQHIGALGAFQYSQYDSLTQTFHQVTDPEQRRKIDSLMSPVQLVGKNTPPVLLMHGDKDTLVPFQQSASLATKLKNFGIPVKLIIKNGADHGWKGMNEDEKDFNSWFDQYLR